MPADKATKERISAALSRQIHSMDHAESRENSLNDEFVKLEIEIAAIVFGLSGAISIFGQDHGDLTDPTKILFVIGWVILGISLIVGLIGIHDRQKFWLARMRDARLCYDVWLIARDRTGDADAANTQCLSINKNTMAQSHNWPFNLQTITLSLGILVVFSGLIVQIFS